MREDEIVWRTLADAALSGRRTWPDLAALAAEAESSITSTRHALRWLVGIGAVRARRRGGLTVTRPEKVVICLSAHRNLLGDTLAMTTIGAIQRVTEAGSPAVSIGGVDAAAHWLGTVDVMTGTGIGLMYLDPYVSVELPEGEDVRVVARDTAAARAWRDGFSSLAQTYADLFAMPGRQAAELRAALRGRLFDSAYRAPRLSSADA